MEDDMARKKINRSQYPDEMLAALADHLGQAPQDISCPEDYYAGEWDSEADFAEDYYVRALPIEIRGYVDWKRVADNMGPNGVIFSIDRPDGGVWVFWNR